MAKQLLVKLDGIRLDVVGEPTDYLIEKLGIVETLGGIADALSSTASRLSGDRAEQRESSNWKHRPKGLELRPSGAGWLQARWVFEPSPERQSNPMSYETAAIEALLELGESGASAPAADVPEYVRKISEELPHDVLLWLGDADNPNRVCIRRTEKRAPRLDLDVGLELSEEEASLVADLHTIALEGAAQLRPGPSAIEHGDLLYDEHGLPK